MYLCHSLSVEWWHVKDPLRTLRKSRRVTAGSRVSFHRVTRPIVLYSAIVYLVIILSSPHAQTAERIGFKFFLKDVS